MATLYFHIGMPKTGTSSLQAFFLLNKMKLWNLGYAYPWSPKIESEEEIKITSGNGEFLGRAELGADGNMKDPTVEDRLKQPFENLGGERDIILSSEYFAGWDVKRFRWLADFAARMNYQVKLIVYLRDQGDMAVAHYFQEAKRNPNFDTRRKDMSAFLEYYTNLPYCHFSQHLDMIESVFGADSMVVRPFNRSMFPEGDVILDFLNVLGVPQDQHDTFQTDFKDVNITPQQRDLMFRLKLTGLQPNVAYSDALLAGASELYNIDTRDHSANYLVDPALVEQKRLKFVDGNKAVSEKWFDGQDPKVLLKPKTYKPIEKFEVTMDDLFFWILLTNSALIKSMKEQNRLVYQMREMRRKPDQ